jgi:hypothetical protein
LVKIPSHESRLGYEKDLLELFVRIWKSFEKSAFLKVKRRLQILLRSLTLLLLGRELWILSPRLLRRVNPLRVPPA